MILGKQVDERRDELRVERVGDRERRDDREHADDEPLAQLGEVLDECRLLIGTQAARQKPAEHPGESYETVSRSRDVVSSVVVSADGSAAGVGSGTSS